MNYQETKAYLEKYGQAHLLRFYDTLDPAQQESLLAQIAQIDLKKPQFHGIEKLNQKRGQFAPLGALTLDQIEANAPRYTEAGLEAIRAGKVGAVLLAGGQGSRLGFDHPKGMYNMGKTRTLYIFECLIGNLMKVVDAAGAFVPLYIMTSEDNNDETQAFFEEHKYFGYAPDFVRFFKQETEPAIGEDGKILMKSPSEIVRTPNGNGGWFASMARAGILYRLEKEQIEWLNVFAVDNVLQQIADPTFIGAVLESGCVSGAKVVSKAEPGERVGVLCLEDGRPSIAEYYEMTDEMRTQREPDGTLSYRFGVILNYLFRTDSLIRTLDKSFPLHVAHKAIGCLDENDQYHVPAKPNAYKFETLVLDMVHMQDSCLAYEVAREKEFAPVKNATGVDSVESAQKLLEQNGVVL